MNDSEGSALYLIEILHQTTTASTVLLASRGCILSKFYIKPQLNIETSIPITVVSYRNSTSNHNASRPIIWTIKLYLIEILHQTTTQSINGRMLILLYLIEILHQTTTIRRWETNLDWLYLIEILHQTTTLSCILFLICRCILSKFYIKPQRITPDYLNYQGCILSKFYIKPQQPQ